jgi:hypothetical protein
MEFNSQKTKNNIALLNFTKDFSGFSTKNHTVFQLTVN